MIAARRDVLAAWLVLLAIDLAIVRGGFAAVHGLVRRIRVRRRLPADAGASVAVVNDALGRAAVWYPRRMECLARSAAATWLMRRAGVPAVMVIGVRKMPFYAHAWVEVAGHVVNDAPKVQTLYPAIDRLVPAEETR